MQQNKIHKRISAVLLIFSIGTIIYLTFQSKAQTSALSHPVYIWFKAHGFTGTEHELRSWTHIPEYFMIGIAFAYFGRVRNWSWGWIFAACALIGLLDECVKIWLPSREFDFGDWCRDLVGIFLALLFFGLIQRIFLKKDSQS